MPKSAVRHRLLCLLLFVLVLRGAGFVSAQEFFTNDQYPRLSLIDRTDGLPHNSVSAIQQDINGFLWFGTQGGLARYDGRSFRTYKNVPFDLESLPHDLVQTVYYSDETDELWVGTYSGLAHFVMGESGFTTYQNDPADANSLSDDVVIAISYGPEGDLWVGTQSGLNRMRADGSFERIETESDVVRALFLDSRNTLWVGTYAGLSRWNPDDETLERVQFGWSSPYAMAIDEIEPGRLLLGTWGADSSVGGLVRVDINNQTFEEIRFQDNRVYTVLAGSDGTHWVGTWGGGLHAITADGRRFSISDDVEGGLKSPVVYSLFEDEAGLIWVGTNGGGLHNMSPRRRNFRAFYHDPDDETSLPAGKINEIYRDRTGRLWVGLYSGGLAWFDAEEERWNTYEVDPNDPTALINDIVTTIYEDRAGHLWIGSNGGLQRYDREGDRFLTWGEQIFPDSEYAGDIVYELAEDAEGAFWIGTYHQGVTRVDLTTGETDTFRADADDPGSLSNNLIYDMYTDSRGDFWIATNGGLNRFDPATESFEVFRYDPNDPNGLTSNTVRVIFEDSREILWVGTVSGGLNRLDRDTGRITHLTEADGLSDNSIVTIEEGLDGRLWLGTQRGLTSYDPVSGVIDTLDERDGLYGSEFENGSFRDDDGSLLFGASHGITKIDSSAALRNTHSPRVQIVDVEVFQESIDSDRVTFNDATVELQPGETFVEFEFVGLDYESSESNRYAYQLLGFDRERIDAGMRNHATYTNLPPGRYELLVWAANSDGVWSPEPAQLTLVVNTPWYSRWWAYVLYATAAALFVVSVLRWRTAHALAEKNRDLEYANSQLERANAELERLSVRDSLTGLFNRRYFDNRLQEEWFRARRSAVPIAVVMIDVDHFKRFNDSYGHIIGDQVLSAAAKIFESSLPRKTDVIARYGGEEFVALLFDTPQDGAVRAAERIREAVASEQLVPRTGSVTVSLGVAVAVPDAGTSPEALVDRADQALYAAKRNGRNRVERG